MDSCAGAAKGSLTAPAPKEMVMFRRFQYLVQRFKIRNISVLRVCKCDDTCIQHLRPAQKYQEEIMCCWGCLLFALHSISAICTTQKAFARGWGTEIQIVKVLTKENLRALGLCFLLQVSPPFGSHMYFTCLNARPWWALLVWLTRTRPANPVRPLLQQHLQLHLWALMLPSLWAPCSYNLWSCSQKLKCMEILWASILSCLRPVCLLLVSRPFGKTSIREIRNGFQMMLCSNSCMINVCLRFALNLLNLLNNARSWKFAAMMNLPCPLHRFLWTWDLTRLLLWICFFPFL